MKKLYILAIVALLASSITAQAEAYYLYNIYSSSYKNNNHFDKQKIKIKIKGNDNVIDASQYGYFGYSLDKQKLKIKIKGDNNFVTSSQKSYQYPYYSYLYPQPTPTPTPAPVPVPVPQPNPISYYYNYYYNNPQPSPIPYYYNYYYNPQPQPQPQNRQPVWNQTSSQVINVGQQLQFYVSAYDPDNDYLNYSASNLPSGASFNSYSRMLVWTPSVYQAGYYNVNFRVTDNINYPVDISVSITVQNNQYYSSPIPTPPPNICFNQIYWTSQSPSANAHEGQFYTYAIQAASYNCPIAYRLISGPVGMAINRSGVITWTPNYSQGGQAYAATVAAFNSYSEIIQTFYVYVEDGMTVVEYPQVEKLKITDVVIQSDARGDAWVNWETNQSSTSRVIFDLVSQANKTKDFTYSFATPDDIDLITGHQVNLGQLESNKTFYLRAVSKKGSEVVVSNELTFVKLPCSAGNSCLVASVWSFGNFFSSDVLLWLLLLIIVILGVALMRSYRKPVAISRLQ